MARRAARAACESGALDPRLARAWLDAHLPLSTALAEELGLLERLLPSASWAAGLPLHLLSACDLRCDQALVAWQARAAGEGAAAVRELLALQGQARWRTGLERFGAAALVHAEPCAGEALELLGAAKGSLASLPPALELTLLHLLSEVGGDRAVALELAQWPAGPALSASQLELARVSAGLGGPSRERAPLRVFGLPWRPEWAPAGPPLQLRDGLSLSWRRQVLEGPAAAAFAAAPALLLLDVDDLSGFNQRCGHAAGDLALGWISERLRVELGDRAVRTSGDEWLVAWEGPDARARAESLVAARRAAGPPTLRIALDQRPGPLDQRLRRLERALLPGEEPHAALVFEVP